MKTTAKHELATKEHSPASYNRIPNCPQNTQNNAEIEFFICVHLRVLRAKAFSFAASFFPWRAVALAKAARLAILSASLSAIAASATAEAQTQQAWVAHYNNGILNGTNQAVKMALDAAGNIYVTGFSQNANTNLGYVTIKYAPNGTQLWASRYDSTNYPSAAPTNLVVDASNNVIVTGNALTVKYDSNGNQLWTAPYAGTALAVDSNSYVYVTGYGTNFNTVKLTPTGSTVWQSTYVDEVGPTLSQAILVDSNSNVYVAGSDNYEDGGEGPVIEYYWVQLAVIKFNTNGSAVWTTTDEGPLIGGLSVVGLALDSEENLYIEVNGQSFEGYNPGFPI